MARVDVSDTTESDAPGEPQGGPISDRPPIDVEPHGPVPVAPDQADADPQVEMVEATSDEAAEGVDWVRTGWVRMRIRGADGQISTYRLRAPLLREMKRLRLALEDAEDEVTVRSQAMLRAAAEMQVQMQKARADLAEPARSDRLAELLRADRRATREFTDYAEGVRTDWLAAVFASPLAVDGAPDDFPAYAVTPEFCGQLLSHWRTVPLAPGR